MPRDVFPDEGMDLPISPGHLGPFLILVDATGRWQRLDVPTDTDGAPLVLTNTDGLLTWGTAGGVTLPRISATVLYPPSVYEDLLLDVITSTVLSPPSLAMVVALSTISSTTVLSPPTVT